MNRLYASAILTTKSLVSFSFKGKKGFSQEKGRFFNFNWEMCLQFEIS